MMKNDKVCAVCEKRRVNRVFAAKMFGFLILQVAGLVTVLGGLNNKNLFVGICIMIAGTYTILRVTMEAFNDV